MSFQVVSISQQAKPHSFVFTVGTLKIQEFHIYKHQP